MIRTTKAVKKLRNILVANLELAILMVEEGGEPPMSQLELNFLEDLKNMRDTIAEEKPAKKLYLAPRLLQNLDNVFRQNQNLALSYIHNKPMTEGL